MIKNFMFIGLDGSGIIRKRLRLDATLIVPTQQQPSRKKQVSELSLADDTPIIDGVACAILQMSVLE